MAEKQAETQSVLGEMRPAKAIIKLAVPATLALLAKAVYNLVDTAYIGMLDSDIALTAVGVTVPLLLIMVSIENIFAAGAGVLAGRQLGAKDEEGASRTVTTIIGLSVVLGILLCVGGIVFMDPIMRAFGAKDEDRFHESVRFALKGALVLTVLVAAVYILLSRPLILAFNRNPVIVDFGRKLLISQMVLYPAFGLCYMMTITYQTIGASRYGLFLSVIRQGLFYVPFILTLPWFLGVTGIYFSQPAADILTVIVCLLSVKSMKSIASRNMGAG